MICNNCNRLIDDDTKFCRFCGKAVVHTAIETKLAIIAIPQPQEQVMVKDKISVLKELKSLWDDEVLSKDEFNAMKKGILESNSYTDAKFKEISGILREMKSLYDTEILTEQEFLEEKYKLLQFNYVIEQSSNDDKQAKVASNKTIKKFVQNKIVIEDPEFNYHNSNNLTVKRIELGPYSTIISCAIRNSTEEQIIGSVQNWKIVSGEYELKQTNIVDLIINGWSTKLVTLEFPPLSNDIDQIDLVSPDNDMSVYGIMI